MTKKHYFLLFISALIVFMFVASFQNVPGYMDADYYYSGGLQLAEGNGFSEMFLWNYLDDPQELPHPSHTYWMPLTSIIAYFGIYSAPFLSKFKAAQLGFIVISALIPVITANLSYKIFKDKNKALFSGLLAIFSGFYLSYMTTTDSFSIYMILGGLFFLIFSRLEKDWHFLILGLLAGLMHMARADGLIWLLVSFSVVWAKRKKISVLKISIWVLLAYFSVSSIWLLRNWNLYGSFLAQGGERAMFLNNYNELFSYPASTLNFEHFSSSGIWNIVQSRWEAVLTNLQTGFAVQGFIFLGPLALLSAWRKRKDLRIQVGWIAWLLTFLIMSIIFPFSGARGGLFHSGAAFMPLIWALSIDGLDTFILWFGGKRAWDLDQAKKVLRSGIILLVILFSTYLSIQKISTWSETSNSYSKIEAKLINLGAEKEDIVLVINPPSYYVETNRASIAIPNGGLHDIFELNRMFQAKYLLLEVNHPEVLNHLYRNPHSLSGLEYLTTVWDIDENDQENYIGTHIFKVDPN